MKKDTLGNPLPARVMLPANATQTEFHAAMSVNSFNLAVEIAMKQGKMVYYDDRAKKADIVNAIGIITEISHQ